MSKSIEELLELVKSKPSTKRKEKEDHRNVMEFVADLKIESGTRAVPNYLIFYFYRNIWNSQGDQKRKAKKITFFQTFGKHFPDYRIGKQRYYLLKEELFDVDSEVLKKAKLYDKQYWSKKTKKKEVSAPEQSGSEII